MSAGLQHKKDTPQLRRALTALASAGDREAFECLYALNHPKFIRVAYRLCGDHEAAKDIVQDAAIIMARKIRRLKDPSAFTPWGYRIIRYRVQDHFRKTQRRGQAQPLDEDVLAADNNTDLDANMSLRQSLTYLNAADRQLLLMFYVDGFTGTELAGALGIPIGTIKSRLFKIRKQLKSIYTQQGDYHE